jgi:hypothetical protein
MLGVANVTIERLLCKCKTFYGVFSCDSIPPKLGKKADFLLFAIYHKKTKKVHILLL